MEYAKMHNNQIGYSIKLLDHQILNGNSLLAELYRLSLIAPIDFFNPQSSPFSKLLVDFSYFADRESIEIFAERTEVTFSQKFNCQFYQFQEGHQLEEKFYPTFSPFLKNFARFLDKLCSFINDFAKFIKILFTKINSFLVLPQIFSFIENILSD